MRLQQPIEAGLPDISPKVCTFCGCLPKIATRRDGYAIRCVCGYSTPFFVTGRLRAKSEFVDFFDRLTIVWNALNPDNNGNPCT